MLNKLLQIDKLLLLLVIVIGIVAVLLGRFFWFLLQWMIFKLRTNHFSIEMMRSKELLGSREWERQMASLSFSHKNTKIMKHNITVSSNNQYAYRKLKKIRNTISEINSDIISMIPASRWLFDNFQMMYREIKKMKTTDTNCESMPILKYGEFRNYPRSYILARNMVELSGGYLNEDNIVLMINAYQREQPLTIKELWTLPEMIGLSLLEQIIFVSEEIVSVIKIKNKAEKYVKKYIQKNAIIQEDKVDISKLLNKLSSDCRGNASFHGHVIYLLKNLSVGDDIIQQYISYHCNTEGRYLNSSEVFIKEGKLESLLESSIRTLIVSLWEINQLDEEKLFEKLSIVEHVLSRDPAEVYSNMDSESRALYRSIVGKLALRYDVPEVKVANMCLNLAYEKSNKVYCNNHVGAYLVGKGYPLLKAAVQGKQEPKHNQTKKNKNGIIYFVMCVFVLSFIGIAIFYIINRCEGTNNIILGGIFLLVSSPILISIVQEIANMFIRRFVEVKKLPSLNYLTDIPDRARTYVVMPVILSSKEQGIEYIERLEKYYLANKQSNLYYALLVDYADSQEAITQEDTIIEEALKKRIMELNKKYKYPSLHFSLFIRCRNWNESENCYMGWERKRGKLEEFNALLQGISEEETSFSCILCDRELLGTFKYVITLDADSNLIRDNAAKLVGLIDHPLNRAVIDPLNKKVIEGYAIIQPSVKNHIVNKNDGIFSRLFSGQTGIESYSTVISDVYQDIFKEGSYLGKGIYNIQVFHKLLNKKIPENTVLSHDLLESCYVRTGFTSSASIMDNFPNSVISFAKREHRWIRGDWQLLPWIFKKKNLSGLSRWKIIDDLRRSTIPICKVICIFMNLIFLPQQYYLWILILLFRDILNLFMFMGGILHHKIRKPKLAVLHKKVRREIGSRLQRMLIELVLTPYMAYISMDAILRTLYRIFISKKALLRWKTSESVEKSVSNSLKRYLHQMWTSIICAIGIVVVCILVKLPPLGLMLSLLLAIIWGFAFYITYAISKPRKNRQTLDSIDSDGLLMDSARRMWRFFQDFSTKENNWLCPDNYQMVNKDKITDKTSPTNIGLQLLSVLSARDLGFETLSSALEYAENVLYSLSFMKKWNGHLYNWYNIRTLEILHPHYVSTVDSGNFFGHLITLKNGLLEQKSTPIISGSMIKELYQLLQLSQCGLELYEKHDTPGDVLSDIRSLREQLSNRDNSLCEEPYYIDDIFHIIDLLEKEIVDFHIEDDIDYEKTSLLTLAMNNHKYAISLIELIDGLCATIDNMCSNADFTCLYNKKRMLFHIGYHVSSMTIDSGCYDLMASESSLTSFLAIARAEVPVKHWYKLGRPSVMIKGLPSFVSWSGTMFEYLMPYLVMKNYNGSVFTESSKVAVLEQIHYGKQNGIPWGISESQYFRFDLDSNYQYRAFGVPKLRLQSSLSHSKVVAPYATMLALDYAKDDALLNLRNMKAMGVYGKYGFYEAIDFDVPDPINLKSYCIVKSYMVHHLGMSLVAINNFFNKGIMRTRFHSEPIIKATEILLEEKRSTNFIAISKKGYIVNVSKVDVQDGDIFSHRIVNKVAPVVPVAGYISNNKYSLMITSDGDGFSNYNGMMIYRWRSDIYANTGNYIYIKDVMENRLWSSAYHPTYTMPEEYQVIFSHSKVEFKRKDGDVGTHTEVTLSSNKNYEIRKVVLTNHGKEGKKLEISSYIEVVGDSFLAELSHPAFNKLFIESEFIESNNIFLSRRRSNTSNTNPYLMHMVNVDSTPNKVVEYENDRLRFIGRNNTLCYPSAIDSMSFANNTGFSNDPIMSIRVQIKLEPGEKKSVFFITGVCNSKEEAIQISDELSVEFRINNVFESFRQQSEMELKYLGITTQQVNAFQDLISPIYYPSMYYRGPQENIRRNWKNQSFLWRFGVSGDNPIMLLRVESIEEKGIIMDVLRAYEYFRINQIRIDLIILSEAKHGYMQDLTDMLNDMIRAMKIYEEDRERPSLFILHAYQMIPAEIDLLFTVARIVFSNKTGIYFRNIKKKIIDSIEL